MAWWSAPSPSVYRVLWQSPRGKRAMTHWASLLRWIWSISVYNLMSRDYRKGTPMGGPVIRERRGSGPEKQKPKHNSCWPVGRNWRKPIFMTDHVTLATSGSAGKIRHLLTVCLTKVHMIGWNPNGVLTRSMIFVRWHSPSQLLTAKHVLYLQLTATGAKVHLLSVKQGLCRVNEPYFHIPIHIVYKNHIILPRFSPPMGFKPVPEGYLCISIWECYR